MLKQAPEYAFCWGGIFSWGGSRSRPSTATSEKRRLQRLERPEPFVKRPPPLCEAAKLHRKVAGRRRARATPPGSGHGGGRGRVPGRGTWPRRGSGTAVPPPPLPPCLPAGPRPRVNPGGGCSASRRSLSLRSLRRSLAMADDKNSRRGCDLLGGDGRAVGVAPELRWAPFAPPPPPPRSRRRRGHVADVQANAHASWITGTRGPRRRLLGLVQARAVDLAADWRRQGGEGGGGAVVPLEGEERSLSAHQLRTAPCAADDVDGHR